MKLLLNINILLVTLSNCTFALL